MPIIMIITIIIDTEHMPNFLYILYIPEKITTNTSTTSTYKTKSKNKK